MKSIRIQPTDGTLGAQIDGANLNRPLPEEDLNVIRQTLLDHLVIFLRQQHISEQDQVRFSHYFGHPREHVREQPDRLVKEIFVVSNVEQAGRPIGALGSSEIDFHSDLSYQKKPGVYSFLYAIEVPKTGGATQWCNGYAAYEALDEPFKEQLQGMRAVHRHPIDSQNPPEPVNHPVVRTHPETGRKSLYVSPHLTRSIANHSESESRELLEKIFEHMTQSQFIWTHHWQVGDLVVWDNRCTMHRRLAFPDHERRLMKRTQIFGDQIPQP